MIPVHVNPHHVKKSKELDDNNPSKNDRKDPKVIAGLVKDGRYFRPYIPDGIYAEIRALSGLQVLAQSEITRLKNRIWRDAKFRGVGLKTVIGNWSQQTTENEPVVGRNFVHSARPCKGAKLTPWLWAGGTKEVRTRGKPKVILVDTGGALP